MQLLYNTTLGAYLVNRSRYPSRDFELVLTKEGKKVSKKCLASDSIEHITHTWSKLPELNYATFEQIREAIKQIRARCSIFTKHSTDKTAAEAHASIEQVYQVSRKVDKEILELDIKLSVEDSLIRDDVAQLKTKITTLKAELTSSTPDLGGLRNDIADCRTADTKTIEEIAGLRTKLEDVQGSAIEDSKSLTRVIDHIFALRTANDELEKSNTELKTQVSNLSSEVDLLRTICTQASQLAESTKINYQAANMIAQMQEDKATIEALRLDNAGLKTAVAEERAEAMSTVAELKSAMEGLKKEVDALKDAKQGLAGAVMFAQESVASAEREGLPTNKKRKRKQYMFDGGEMRSWPRSRAVSFLSGQANGDEMCDWPDDDFLDPEELINKEATNAAQDHDESGITGDEAVMYRQTMLGDADTTLPQDRDDKGSECDSDATF